MTFKTWEFPLKVLSNKYVNSDFPEVFKEDFEGGFEGSRSQKIETLTTLSYHPSPPAECENEKKYNTRQGKHEVQIKINNDIHMSL